MRSVQIQIQFEHVDARFAQESELPLLCMLSYERLHFRLAHAAFARHARNLKPGGGGREVRIES